MASGISIESPHQIQELGDVYDIKSKSVKNASNNKLGRNCRKFSRQDSSNQSLPKVFHGKRRHSFSCMGEGKTSNKKRIRHVLPTRFLLGGNICDPLNLGSLADEEINKKLNEVTPQSSPIPIPKHRTQVEVLIPSNINDPLNLNSGEDIHFLPPKPKKHRRHRNRKKKSGTNTRMEVTKPTEISGDTVDGPQCETQSKPPELDLKINAADVSATKGRGNERARENACSKSGDKIVSPVLPQGSPLKFHRRFHLRNFTTQTVSDNVETPSTSQGSAKKQKFKRQNKDKPVRFREKDAQFRYGNYNRYYGYRNKECDDPRLRTMRRDWFEGKDVLDIGCNIGHVTLTVAHDFNPRKIIGLDIDDNLIKIARKNVRHYLTTELIGNREFPISLALCYGPIVATDFPGRGNEQPKFPNNVFFVQGNYVLESDELLESQTQEFDMILCLSLTKWVHLNWGDDGLKRLFKRMFLQLRPGGRMLLEAQPWPSYAKKKKMTETTYKNYHSIKLRPEQFNEFLLSKEVGFSTCELVDTPSHPSKGFTRPLYLFTKAGSSSPTLQETNAVDEKPQSTT